MNKKILILLALVVVAAVMSVSQLADSSVLKSTKSHKWGGWNKNKWGGYDSGDSDCQKTCGEKSGTWCGPHWNHRYYCCDTAANCLDKE